ncbi:MAG: hypothetical protein N2316_00720 [Spirochaetes bacterium]|nr:hypothetical protein [Spirochaetota bacterium]
MIAGNVMGLLNILLFISAICCMGIAACCAMCALHGNNDRFKTLLKFFFYVGVFFFVFSGVVRYFPFGLRDFILIARTIWGHLYLLVLFLILLLIYIHLSRWGKHWIPVAAVVLPFITIISLLSLPLISSNRIMDARIANHLLPFHVIFALSGELFFLLASAGSIIFLYLNFQLKRKISLVRTMSLPSLESIESFTAWASQMAFFLLSIGLVLGIILVWINFKTLFLFSFKEIVMYISWLCVFCVYLLRRKKLAGATTISLVTIVLFIVAGALFVVANFFREAGFHSFK